MIEAFDKLVLFVGFSLAILVGLPVVVYLSVKFGTVAFYSGRRFSRRMRKENVKHGER